MSTKVRLSAAIVHYSICAIDLPAEILSAREKDPPEKGMSQGGQGSGGRAPQRTGRRCISGYPSRPAAASG